ncbi:rhamnose-binding lectin-like [Trichomycterus rosablanca]|uniref:rhamnose-binding lectin-like n=1 Tax=Trichomycterus rosablanca TaxID=2290929 RepID=UPI002F359E90
MMFLKLSLLTFLIVAPGLLVSAENAITCYGNVQRLGCDSGVISTETANYGRTTESICNSSRPAEQIVNTNCLSSATSAIAKRCNGLKDCEFNTNSLNLADPCVGTYKYFNTTYTCVSIRTKVICEDSHSELNCRTSKIFVLNAMYGRTDTTTCISGRPSSETNNPNCNFNTRDKVSQLCNGQNKCCLFASNTIFTDPCFGTLKYLSVYYTCI